MKKWWLISLATIAGNVYAFDPTGDCTFDNNGNQRCITYHDGSNVVKNVFTIGPNGRVIGESPIYYPSGKLKSTMRYNDQGEIHGKIMHYWENGKVKAAIDYKNNLADGFSHEYDESGKLVVIWQYKNDLEVHMQEMNGKVKHGKEVFFRNDNGVATPYRVIEWNNGKKVKEQTE